MVSIGEPACLVLQDAYLFAGPFVSNGVQSLRIRMTDIYGETKWLKNFEEGDHVMVVIVGGILTNSYDDFFLLAGSRSYSLNGWEQDITMLKFSDSGDTSASPLMVKTRHCRIPIFNYSHLRYGIIH